MEDKKDIVYTCTNPQVLNRTLMCDGNCWNCGYHQPLQSRIGNLEIINDGESYTKGYKAALKQSYDFFKQWENEPGMAEKLAEYKKAYNIL